MALLCLCCFALNTAAQKSILPHPLGIGERLPESFWTLEHMIIVDGNKTVQNLSAYRGKLLILDFWATWCSSCIAALPKLHQLETEFNADIEIVPVSYEDPKTVASFLKTNSSVKDLGISSIVLDQTLADRFPHKSIPHLVWITKDGRVMSFTSTEGVDTIAVQRALEKGNPNLMVKIDVDLRRPLFTSDALPINSLSFYSMLLKGSYPGLPGGVSYEKPDDKVIGMVVRNTSISAIYRNIAINMLKTFKSKKIFIDTAGQDKSIYTYQYRNTNLTADSFFSSMLSHLNTVTGMDGKIETRRLRTLYLSYEQTAKNTHGAKSTRQMIKLLSLLNTLLPVIVTDSSGYPGNIDLSQFAGKKSPEEIFQALKVLGLELNEREEEMEVFVLNHKRK